MTSRPAEASAALKKGKAVVVVDTDGAGDLLCAAQFATPALVAFLVRHTSGFLYVAMPERDADRLGLPAMVSGEAHAVTVDARHGAGTGISARDRAHTARLLADATTVAGDLTRPGHIVPLRARSGGVVEHPGRAEASVDLLTLAGLRPSGLVGAIVSERYPATMARQNELVAFAARHDLCMIGVADLIAHSRAQRVERVACASVRLGGERFRTERYRDADGLEHAALLFGTIDGVRDIPLWMHAECLAGDVFGSQDCNCVTRVRESVATTIAQGRGVLVYLREGVVDPGAVTRQILAQHNVESVQMADANCAAVLRACGLTVTTSAPNAKANSQSITRIVRHGGGRRHGMGCSRPSGN